MYDDYLNRWLDVFGLLDDFRALVFANEMLVTIEDGDLFSIIGGIVSVSTDFVVVDISSVVLAVVFIGVVDSIGVNIIADATTIVDATSIIAVDVAIGSDTF